MSKLSSCLRSPLKKGPVFFKIVSEVPKERTKALKLGLFTSYRSRLLRLREGVDKYRIYVRTLETSDAILKKTVLGKTCCELGMPRESEQPLIPLQQNKY